MNMELWFILAVTAAVTSGIEAFTHKVAAERKYDSALFSLYAAAISVLVLLVGVLMFSDFSDWFSLASILVVCAGGLYFLTFISKIAALKEIDSAVFFPIYKITGPLLTIVIGIILFGESFSWVEWIGLGLSMCVPLLLITKAENQRQNNLKKGLLFLLCATAAGSIAMTLHKSGVDLTLNLWLIMLLNQASVFAGSVIFLCAWHKQSVLKVMQKNTNYSLIKLSIILGLFGAGSTLATYNAFANGGPLGIVYTISSIYILIPIVLSIIIYKEHWNAQKVIAIVVSILALGLLQ